MGKQRRTGWILGIFLALSAGAPIAAEDLRRPPVPSQNDAKTELDRNSAQERGPSGRTQDESGDRTIPFKLYREFAIVVEGSAAGLEGLKMMVDSGAVQTTLDRRVIKRLGLAGTDVNALNPVSGRQLGVQEVVLPRLEVGPLTRRNLPVLSQDLSTLRALGRRLDGIVGLDLLVGRVFIIDYRSRTLTFCAAGDPAADTAKVHGFFAVSLRVQNLDLRVILDTGANDLVLFAGRLPPGTFESGSDGVLQSLHEAHGVTRIRLPEVSVGSKSLGDLAGVLLSTEAPEWLEADGMIGPCAMGVDSILVDLYRGRILPGVAECPPRAR